MIRNTLVLSTLLASAFVQAMPSHQHHLDLELTGREYMALLAKQPNLKMKKIMSGEDLQIEAWLALGKRNLQWVDFVNASRSPERKLSLSSPATQAGNGPSAPRFYNFKMIKEKWDIVRDLIPAPLKAVIFEGKEFTTDIGVSDREFMEWLFQVDSAYQIASRYKLMLPYKEEMKAGAAYDVRGYLQLNEEENLDDQLKDYANLPDLKQSRFTRSLVMICMNSEKARKDCKKELNAAIEAGTVVDFKNTYMPAGKGLYDYFFTIAGTRPDGVWTSADPNNMHIPFANPHNEAVLNYLRDNIQDEWKWNGWQLHIDFVESSDEHMTHIVWEEGATPHVDNAPGTTITMDANSPLSEYDVQWTIRHEYGHVLGFPDCYEEFYDEEEEAFISYQLDVTNLMCSRRGKLKQVHFDELKRAYYKE
ncbi:MAG: hypothetical protein ACJ76H_11565 [Bacteriovoracaceae bacterium]